MKRLLVIAPHADDAELGCGGAIGRLARAGVRVVVVALTRAGRPELDDEFHAAVKVLGAESRTQWPDYPVRRFSQCRQDILDRLLRLKKECRPDMVFVPASTDVHQDHQVVHAEALRAFRDVTLWGYELPWNHLIFSTQGFVTLSAADLARKWEALRCYKSQIGLKRRYFHHNVIESLARIRGLQIGVEFAEAFEIIRTRI